MSDGACLCCFSAARELSREWFPGQKQLDHAAREDPSRRLQAEHPECVQARPCELPFGRKGDPDRDEQVCLATGLADVGHELCATAHAQKTLGGEVAE